MHNVRFAAVLILAMPLVAARAAPQEEPQPAPSYTPGLGDIMGPIQMRHAKLWFAGARGNWPLAAYELDEIKEGFEQAAQFQPDFKGRPVAKLVEEIITPKLAAVATAIASHNPPRFAQAFDQLTQACNACHRAAGYGFIAIQRPTRPPYSNQRFGSH